MQRHRVRAIGSLALAFVVCASAATANPPAKRIPAFPGAEGAGAYTVGGRGGRVLEVTNLNAHGPGSLQWACDQKGPRLVVFRVAGVIRKPAVVVRNPFITIAGQSAPGDGICIRGMISIKADQVVLRYLRARPGDDPLGVNAEERDCIALQGQAARDIIIDHCSASWGLDENISAYGPYDNVTIQWTITSEALYDSIHNKGPHSMGMILQSYRDTDVTVHHCLFAQNMGRNPLITANKKAAPLYDIRNNVCYARFPACLQIIGHPRVNLVGHVIKRGVPGPYKNWRRWFGVAASNRAFRKLGPALLYVEDNRWPADPEGKGDPWAIGSKPGRPNKFLKRAPMPLPAKPVTTQLAAEGYEAVLRYAGATRPVRDVVDQRVIADVRDGLGRVIDSQDEVGGWPVYAGAPPPPDRDHDGMPDAWEKTHGLNPADPKDGPADKDGDGYTNVEEYLNETNPARPDTAAPAPKPVKLQTGNDHLRGAAARAFGERWLAAREKPDATPESSKALVARAKASGEDVADLLGIKMVRVPPGEFEVFKIRFRVTRPFLIGATEVTQAQWQAVMGARPWRGRQGVKEDPACPATYVSYMDAQEFLRRLNACGGPTWRLPTFAEWRVAARGGTKHKYGFPGDVKKAPEYAWCCYRIYKGKGKPKRMFPGTPQAVARLKPNAFGLYDMAGNVREWVSDYASVRYFLYPKKWGLVRTDPTGPETGIARTIAGGMFRHMNTQLLERRPYAGHKPYYRGFDVGLRLARNAR